MHSVEVFQLTEEITDSEVVTVLLEKRCKLTKFFEVEHLVELRGMEEERGRNGEREGGREGGRGKEGGR